METSEEPGRREQNRLRTHNALVAAANRLFQEQGYEATTVRDIATAAGVGERTFFRYFPSKENLVLQQVRDLIPLLAAEIRRRPTAEPPLVALREALLALAARQDTSPAVLLAGPRPFTPEPISRGDRFLLFDLEETVAAAFLERAGITEPGLREELRAATLSRAGVGALRTVRLAHARLSDAERAEADPSEMVRIAFAALGA
ncbi:TetR/AcrR family transcriptional regulator [Kitasatospora sp. RB6PN24]|uniref:helix-turn-helix domain-containing protein n=1 Tax=Kitasatospora humi TaxID=2893891 RepID=UPI001E502222|nr:TetR/AcrR family transcriptional regulator [Kitasatospora humi]MCC9308449.1 TetR/AcrR family transcriptional regulator [Kitasatospora humi]